MGCCGRKGAVDKRKRQLGGGMRMNKLTEEDAEQEFGKDGLRQNRR